MVFQGKISEILEVKELEQVSSTCALPRLSEGELCLIWFCSEGNEMIIDTKLHRFAKDQIICLTEFNRINWYHLKTIRYIRFNRPFYCILGQESEVSCRGILYYGSSEVPAFNLCKVEKTRLENFWQILLQEMKESDSLQLEMLQMLLKQILIICLRLYKRERKWDEENPEQINIIQEFNYLLETHFTALHRVEDYAEMLNKSPKTLSNIFKKLIGKSPLQLIRERILLEAKRYLCYTEMPVSEIGYALGYEDVQSFSRFFRQMENVSPSYFRENAPDRKN
ncbi:MAG: helix-turn-helix domain-containing protein [Flavobacteriaceae bacterium]|nr:helix-turn-helix domain-containing protein [Flavobacteriaceae bacterium]